MAKWGEGDPRWIVEERPDATNVNNWHWTEKNADSWSKKKIENLFVNHVIEDEKVGNVVIEEIEKCEGEARVNNRKAKLIFFYEWEIIFKWKGHVNGNDTDVEGKVEIPNLSEEHEDVNEVDINVTMTTKGKESDILKEFMRKGRGADRVRGLLQDYVDALKKEFSQNLILPAKNDVDASKISQAKVTNSKTTIVNKSASVTTSESGLGSLNIGVRDTGSIELSESFKCTGMEIFNAFTQPSMLKVFTRSEAVIDGDEAKAGVKFSLLSGNIEGTFVEVRPFTKIAQKWRLKSWPSGHYSDVVITISQTDEDTTVNISQSNVPVKEMDNTRQGWQRYYFHAIKQSFGFGVPLY